MFWETVSEVKVHNIHCSSFTHSAGRDITEGYQVSEAMLTIPDNLLFFDFLGDDIRNKLLHYLPRDRGKAGWSVVSWLLLLALLDIGFPPVLRHHFNSL